MKIYRKIFIKYYGKIPKDKNNRTFDIHHIDGNRKNNNPSNLVALSIYHHYIVHYVQGDYGAALRIAQRIEISPEEKSELSRKSNQQRVTNGTHPWLNKEKAKKQANKRVKEGTHNFLGGELQRKRVANGTHNFLGPKTNMKRIIEGTHHLLGSTINQKLLIEGKHHSQKEYICPQCEKIGKGNKFKGSHFNRCINKSKGFINV